MYNKSFTLNIYGDSPVTYCVVEMLLNADGRPTGSIAIVTGHITGQPMRTSPVRWNWHREKSTMR